MSLKVVGKQNVDYMSKKTNQQVTGITLHIIGQNSRVEGMAVDTIFVSSKSNTYNTVASLPIGAEIDVLYNRWGNVETVELCKK